MQLRAAFVGCMLPLNCALSEPTVRQQPGTGLSRCGPFFAVPLVQRQRHAEDLTGRPFCALGLADPAHFDYAGYFVLV